MSSYTRTGVIHPYYQRRPNPPANVGDTVECIGHSYSTIKFGSRHVVKGLHYSHTYDEWVYHIDVLNYHNSSFLSRNFKKVDPKLEPRRPKSGFGLFVREKQL